MLYSCTAVVSGGRSSPDLRGPGWEIHPAIDMESTISKVPFLLSFGGAISAERLVSLAARGCLAEEQNLPQSPTAWHVGDEGAVP